MRWKGFLLLLLILVLIPVGCSVTSLPLPRDSRAAVPPTTTVEPLATKIAEPIPESAGGYARAFYRAWENGDLDAMYALLTPRSQALVGRDAFVQRYADAMEKATVLEVRAQPLSLVEDGPSAEFGVRVNWETAVVGPIVRDYTVPLSYDNGRWGIEWREGLILPELDGGNRLLLEQEVPNRANIYDVNGQALAYQGEAITLSIIPSQIQDETGLLNALAAVLERTPEEIKARYADADPNLPTEIADIPRETMQDNVLSLQPYIGFGLVSEGPQPARFYTGSAPHLVGYTGFIPAAEVEAYRERGYSGDEIVGLSGLEAWGESYLNGERGGVLKVVSPNNDLVAVVAERPPQQARSIYTTLDLSFQTAVNQALADAIATHPLGAAGAVVVLDVDTGAVLAMASYPSYDATLFNAARPGGQAELARVLNDPGRPLVNRAAQGAYPAGSVFKIVSMEAALNSDQYTADTLYNSTGSWNRLGDEFIKYDWRPGGHGTVTLKQALIVSCNSCFYDVGYNLDAVDNTLLPRMAQASGLGQATGIAGIAESSGLIPDPEWKIVNVGEGWATGDAVNMAIGQGYVQVTPLQIARLLAAVANEGVLLQPTLIDRIGAGGGAPEEAWPVEENGRLPLTSEQLAVFQDALWNVANGSLGTATDKFAGLPVQVAGKTGTAEAPPNDPHAWFAGYAPAAPYTTADGSVIEEPEIAVAVLVEHAGEGSAVAAPLFRRIVELYYGITPLASFPWE